MTQSNRNSSLARKALSGIGAQRISLRKSQHRDRISGNRARFVIFHSTRCIGMSWRLRIGMFDLDSNTQRLILALPKLHKPNAIPSCRWFHRWLLVFHHDRQAQRAERTPKKCRKRWQCQTLNKLTNTRVEKCSCKRIEVHALR